MTEQLMTMLSAEVIAKRIQELGAEITRESLAEAGVIRSRKGHVKLLANGEVPHAVTVRGVQVSAGAREKIVAAGGRIEE